MSNLDRSEIIRRLHLLACDPACGDLRRLFRAAANMLENDEDYIENLTEELSYGAGD